MKKVHSVRSRSVILAVLVLGAVGNGCSAGLYSPRSHGRCDGQERNGTKAGAILVEPAKRESGAKVGRRRVFFRSDRLRCAGDAGTLIPWGRSGMSRAKIGS